MPTRPYKARKGKRRVAPQQPPGTKGPTPKRKLEVDVGPLPDPGLPTLKQKKLTSHPAAVDIGTLCEQARLGALGVEALASLVSRLHQARMGLWEIANLVNLTQAECQELIRRAGIAASIERAELRHRERGVLETIRQEAWAAWLSSADPTVTEEVGESQVVLPHTGEVVTLTKRRRKTTTNQRHAAYLTSALNAAALIMKLEGLEKPHEERDGDDELDNGMAIEIEYVVKNEPQDPDAGTTAEAAPRRRSGHVDPTHPGATPVNDK